MVNELPKFKINGIEYFLDLRLKEIRTLLKPEDKPNLRIFPLTSNDVDGFEYLLAHNEKIAVGQCIKDIVGL